MDLLKTNSIQKVLKTFILIFIGTMALTISAKLKIPFYPVPMTMQTFVVLFLGIAFGYKIGLASVAVYLLEGILGMPVFSNSPEKGIGIVYFTGPTMGYLIGFLFASFFALSTASTFLFLMTTLCVSSAKFVIMLSLVHKSISAIRHRHMKSNGDSLDPCGTPVFMSIVFDIFPATVTNCFRFFRYDSTHFRAFLSNP